jgi:hypothetical protein
MHKRNPQKPEIGSLPKNELLVFTFELQVDRNSDAEKVFNTFFIDNFCPHIYDGKKTTKMTGGEAKDFHCVFMEVMFKNIAHAKIFEGKMLRKLHTQYHWNYSLCKQTESAKMSMYVNKDYQQVFLAFQSNPLITETMILAMVQLMFQLNADDQLEKLLGCKSNVLVNGLTVSDFSSATM